MIFFFKWCIILFIAFGSLLYLGNIFRHFKYFTTLSLLWFFCGLFELIFRFAAFIPFWIWDSFVNVSLKKYIVKMLWHVLGSHGLVAIRLITFHSPATLDQYSLRNDLKSVGWGTLKEVPHIVIMSHLLQTSTYHSCYQIFQPIIHYCMDYLEIQQKNSAWSIYPCSLFMLYVQAHYTLHIQ